MQSNKSILRNSSGAPSETPQKPIRVPRSGVLAISEPPKFIGKGTYGCTFYPSINACNGQQEDDIDSDHYITKIQKHNPVIEDEIKIGKQIKQLELTSVSSMKSTSSKFSPFKNGFFSLLAFAFSLSLDCLKR